MGRHSSSRACGIFFLLATESFSPLESPTKNTGYSASLPKIKPLLRSNVVVCQLRTTMISFCKKKARPLLGAPLTLGESSALEFVVFPSRRNAEHENC